MSEETDGLVERLLEEPPGPRREQMLAQLDADQRPHVRELLAAGDMVWEAGHTAPPLEEDPVAAMLGLVPDPSFRLDGAALTRACKASGVKPTVLAARLNARGWKVETAEVFRWQTRAAPDVPPALIKAIAEEVRVHPDRLVANAQQLPSLVNKEAAEITATPRFRALVKRFARVQHLSEAMAASALQSRALATVHRGDVPDQEQMLASLEALISLLEVDSNR